jgi:hypothetical protein
MYSLCCTSDFLLILLHFYKYVIFLFLIILWASFLLWWCSCSSSSLLPFINYFSLAFFISAIENSHSSSYCLFLNVSVPSSFFYRLLFSFLDYCFNVFPFFVTITINTLLIAQIFQYFKLLINFYSILVSTLDCEKYSPFFSSHYISSFYPSFHFKMYLQ